MLDGKRKKRALRWELNFIIMQILRKEIVLYCHPTLQPCHVGANQELLAHFLSFKFVSCQSNSFVPSPFQWYLSVTE